MGFLSNSGGPALTVILHRLTGEIKLHYGPNLAHEPEFDTYAFTYAPTTRALIFLSLFLVLPPPPSLSQRAIMGRVDSAVSSGSLRTFVSARMTRLTFNAQLMPRLG